jgi:hypothetical protein
MRESANVFCLTGRDRDAAFDPIVRRLAAKFEKVRFCTRVNRLWHTGRHRDRIEPRLFTELERTSCRNDQKRTAILNLKSKC